VGRIYRSVLLCCILAGCVRASPALFPTVEPRVSEGLHLFVKPIVTSGFRSEDEQRWGMDLSRYYTAFYIRIQNNTGRRVTLNPETSELTGNLGKVYAPLGEKESIAHYHAEDRYALRAFLPGRQARVDDATQKIVLNRWVSETLDPGAQTEGILYFKKITARYCEDMVLTLKQIEIIGSSESKSISFPFSCAH